MMKGSSITVSSSPSLSTGRQNHIRLSKQRWYRHRHRARSVNHLRQYRSHHYIPAHGFANKSDAAPISSPSSSSSSSSSFISHIRSSISSLHPSSLPFLSALQSKFDIPTAASLAKHLESQPSPYDDIVTHVRREPFTLCAEEQQYIQQRRIHAAANMQRMLEHSPISNNAILVNDPSYAPSIGICLSGGGYRAMLGSLAALTSLEKMNILQCSDYISGLSGSTWAMTQLYSQHPKKPFQSVAELLQQTRIQAAKPFISSHQQHEDNNDNTRSISVPATSYEALMSLIKRTIAEKSYSVQSLTVTDLFGWFLSHRVLSPLAPTLPYRDHTDTTNTEIADHYIASLTLSDQRHSLDAAIRPFPLYTAINTPDHIQFEFSPYEMGSHELAAFIPMFGLGRPYQAGQSVNKYPREPHLSTMLSIFSSAHCTDLLHTIAEIITQSKTSTRIKQRAQTLIQSLSHYKKIYPFSPTAIFNYIHGLDQQQGYEHHPIRIPIHLLQSTTVSLMDAGLAFNYPIIPLLQSHRHLDIIILCDYTAPPEALTGVYFHSITRYCEMHQLPIPRWEQGYQPLTKESDSDIEDELNIMDQLATKNFDTADNMDDQPNRDLNRLLCIACNSRVTVFPGDLLSNIPTVIYIPLMKNRNFDAKFCPREVFAAGGFTSTLNFQYTKEESDLLCGLVQRNMEECETVIQRCIQERWQERTRYGVRRRSA